MSDTCGFRHLKPVCSRGLIIPKAAQDSTPTPSPDKDQGQTQSTTTSAQSRAVNQSLNPPPQLSRGGIRLPWTQTGPDGNPIGIDPTRFDSDRIGQIVTGVRSDCSNSVRSQSKQVRLQPVPSNVSIIEMEAITQTFDDELRQRKAYTRQLNEYLKSYRAHLNAIRSDYNRRINENRQNAGGGQS